MKHENSENIYFVRAAFKEAEKSNCPRTKVGCVLVKNHNILVSAHNDEVQNLGKCSKEGCIRIIKGIATGAYGEVCRGIHAEQKLIINCLKNNIDPSDGIVYLTHAPCLTCAKILLEAGISELYYCIDYPTNPTIGSEQLFEELKVKYKKVRLEEDIQNVERSI